LICLNVLDGANGQILYIYIIERVVAVNTAAIFIAWFIIIKAGTAVILAS